MTNFVKFAIVLLLRKKIKMKIYTTTETDVLKSFDLQYEDVKPEIIKVRVIGSHAKISQ